MTVDTSTDGVVSRLMAASLTTTIAANLPVFLVGGLAVQMRAEIGYGETALGLAVGVFYLAGALSSFATGRLVERVGAERSLRVAATTSAVVQLAIAGLAHSIVTILALLAVAGLVNAWAQPAANVLLTRTVAADRLGFALGLQKSAIPAGALLGGLAVPLIALTVGWRWAFVAGAVFGLAAAVHLPPGEPLIRRAVGRHGGVTDVSSRRLLFLALGVGFGSAASNAMSSFLVSSGVEAGLGAALAGVLLTVGSIAGIGVRLLIGARADRYPGRSLIVIASMFLVASSAFLLLATESRRLFLLGTPLAFATAYAWPGLFHLAVVRSNPSAPAAATGLAMTGTLTGAVGGPVLFGAIADGVSYRAAWLTGSGVLVLAAVIVAISSRLIHEPSTHR